MVVALSAGLVGFNKLNIQAKNIDDSKAEELLSRTIGQTEFANPGYGYTLQNARSGGGLESAPTALASAKSGDQRAVQEADVFKVGKKGSKLLYLLNSLRGLQVVSYADGADKPKLIGRVEATGNSPKDMYYIESRQRLVVLENVYFDKSGQSRYYSENQARLVIYDVSNDAAPKVDTVIDFKGAIRDSRLVGEILYVGSSIEPNWYESRGDQTRMGMVHSFNVDSNKVEKVAEYKLSLPMSYGENMNIVETKKDDGYHYYIVAVLQNSSWSFWGRESVIEVVDISNVNGKIEPIMKVAAKGFVRERSQTLIKDDTLVVVSNYTVDSQQRSRMYVAVESFKFPSQKSEVITQSEAQYRQLWIDRELKKAKISNEEAREAKRKELLANAETGLAGRFVEADGKLVKPYADSVVITGDDEGQSANIRDVRVDGNSLYVFWVPSNQVDPLDLFDISNLDEGVKYVNRLKFEGWIERAVPMTVKGRQFILGLGWVVPAVNNERGRRQAQAALFEIKDDEDDSSKKISKRIVNLELSERDSWAAGFEQNDKYLDIRDNGDGTGSLLFSQYARVGDTWSEGGKIVSYDFNQVFAKQAKKFFSEGGFLVGQSSWIKRIFTNSEISRINSFSDMALATYEDSTRLPEGGIVKAANILELARNIKAFEMMGEGQKLFGAQIVAKGYDWSGDEAITEIRTTTMKKPDAELQDGVQVTVLKGAYGTHVKVNASTLLVYTSQTTYAPYVEGQEQRPPKTDHYVYQVNFDGQTANASNVNAWTTEENYRSSRIGVRMGMMWPGRYYRSYDFIALRDGSYLLSGVPSLKVYNVGQALTVNEYQYRNCPTVAEERNLDQPTVTNVNVRALGGQLFMFHEVNHKLGKTELSYSRKYLSPLSFKKDEAICGKAVSIPGEPLSLEGDNLVTSDTQVLDVVTYMRTDWEKKQVQTWEYLTSQALASVKWTQESATLKDMQTSDDTIVSSMKRIAKNEYLYVKSPENRYYSWRDSDYPSVHQLVFVGVENYLFKTQVKGIYLNTSNGQDVASVLTQGDMRTVVLTSGNSVRVLRWDVKDRQPSIVNVKTSNAFGKGEFAEAAYIPAYFYAMGKGAITFDAATNSVLFSLNTAGVKAVKLQK